MQQCWDLVRCTAEKEPGKTGVARRLEGRACFVPCSVCVVIASRIGFTVRLFKNYIVIIIKSGRIFLVTALASAPALHTFAGMISCERLIMQEASKLNAAFFGLST